MNTNISANDFNKTANEIKEIFNTFTFTDKYNKYTDFILPMCNLKDIIDNDIEFLHKYNGDFHLAIKNDNEFTICNCLTFEFFDENKRVLKELALLMTSIFYTDAFIIFTNKNIYISIKKYHDKSINDTMIKINNIITYNKVKINNKFF